jgi:hypothetical protein
MASDFQKKEPSKNEKLIFELAMQQHSLERSVWSTSAHVVALALVLGVDPKKVAELMVGGDEKIKGYSKTINEEIERLEKEKAPKAETSSEDNK